MTDDIQLLEKFATGGDEDAFRELIERHLDLVYSAALRRVNGDAPLAQDVAQTVFTDLARKARALPRDVVLTSWLYEAARFAAANAIRGERRRQTREQEALTMHDSASESTPGWEQLSPVLDDAMGDLCAADRNAILLRYFKNQDFQTVGLALGVSDAAAQKRVSRAVERLRESFAKRGVNVGASGLVVIISTHSVLVAPAGLSSAITAAALAGTTIATTTIATAITTIAMTTLRKILTVAAVILALNVWVFWWVLSRGNSAPSPVVSLAPTTAKPATLADFADQDTRSWQTVPRGTQVCDGVTFVCDGAIRTAGMSYGKRYPGAVLDVPVHSRSTRIHLLQSSENSSGAMEGAPYGRIILHYANGESRRFDLLFAVHGRDWMTSPRNEQQPVLDENTKLGWSQLHPKKGMIIRFYHTTFANPLPDVEITSADFISPLHSANLLLFGLTVDNDPRPLAAPWQPDDTGNFAPAAAIRISP